MHSENQAKQLLPRARPNNHSRSRLVNRSPGLDSTHQSERKKKVKLSLCVFVYSRRPARAARSSRGGLAGGKRFNEDRAVRLASLLSHLVLSSLSMAEFPSPQNEHLLVTQRKRNMAENPFLIPRLPLDASRQADCGTPRFARAPKLSPTRSWNTTLGHPKGPWDNPYLRRMYTEAIKSSATGLAITI